MVTIDRPLKPNERYDFTLPDGRSGVVSTTQDQRTHVLGDAPGSVSLAADSLPHSPIPSRLAQVRVPGCLEVGDKARVKTSSLTAPAPWPIVGGVGGVGGGVNGQNGSGFNGQGGGGELDIGEGGWARGVVRCGAADGGPGKALRWRTW